MKQIKELAVAIREELEDAECYVKLAIEYRPTDLKLSQMYAELAKAELDHAAIEHDQATRLIKEYTMTGVSAPPGMQAVWDWQHENMIQGKTRIITMLNMLK